MTNTQGTTPDIASAPGPKGTSIDSKFLGLMGLTLAAFSGWAVIDMLSAWSYVHQLVSHVTSSHVFPV
jgi:hypothetical protein